MSLDQAVMYLEAQDGFVVANTFLQHKSKWVDGDSCQILLSRLLGHTDNWSAGQSSFATEAF